VLGGRVLTELTENGGKQRTFVYAGSQVLAWQTLLLGTEQLVWEHRDPSNASFRTTNPNGSLNDQTAMNGRAELDPAGADAALVDPYLFSPPFEENQDSLIAYPSFGSAGSLGTTYSWDGIRMPADELFEMVNTLLHGRFGIAQALMHGTRVSGTRTVTERWRVQPHVQQPEDSDDVVRINTVAPYFINISYAMPLYGTDSLGIALLTPPQNPERMLTRDEVSGLIEDIYSLFKAHSQCEDFMNRLLGELKKNTGYQASSNIRAVLESFRRDGHIFTTGSVNGSSVAGPEGIHLSYLNTREETAAVVLGEIIHAVGFARNNAYTDSAMANAAHNLGVVMSAEQFRHTYPEWVAKYKADYEKAFPGVPGRDYVESKLAHGAIDIKCRDIVNRLLPKYAKP